MTPDPARFIYEVGKIRDPQELPVSDLFELVRMVKDGELVLRSDLTEKDNAA